MTPKTYNPCKCPGVRQVVRYQTADGQTFPSEETAVQHADKILNELIENLLNRITPGIGGVMLAQAFEIIKESRQMTRADLTQILGQLTFGDD